MEDNFQEDKVKVPFGSRQLEAALSVPTAPRDVHVAVVLTHGAGGDMNFRPLVSLAHALACSGFICLRFTCRGPNLAHRVKAFHAAWEYLKSLDEFTIRHIFLCGRSMGSRAAVALARQLSERTEDSVQGVVCLSFPLHPPGQTHRHGQRSEDLRELPLQMPVLFVSGTQDNMCDRVLFDGTLKDMKAGGEVCWLEGGGHDLTVKEVCWLEGGGHDLTVKEVCWLEGGGHDLTVKGRTEESTMEEVNSRVITWIVKHTS